MRRFLSVILTMTLLLMTIPFAAVPTAIAAAYDKGDVNGDSSVGTNDVRQLLRIIVQEPTVSEQQQYAADVTNDGVLTTMDAKWILESVVNGTELMTGVSLLAPSADTWANPVQAASGTPSIITETEASGGGYAFTNNGGSWPYAAYVYDAKVLAPKTALIEYSLTVPSGVSASLVMYTGGSMPDLEGDIRADLSIDNGYAIRLNSFITTNLDAGSGDVAAGTYSGTISVAELGLASKCYADGYLWISAIKIYVAGADYSTVTVNRLSVKGVERDAQVTVATDSYGAIRSGLVTSSETSGLATMTGMELYVNGSRSTATSISSYNDNKKVYNTVMTDRIVNYVDGYRMDLPVGWTPDYSLGALRARYTTDNSVLTVSREEENPYGNTADSWNTYLTEWLNRYIANESFLTANNLSYMRKPIESTSILSGYTVMQYDISINNAAECKMPYYSIAIIRKTTTYDSFVLMVLKSSARTPAVMDRIVNSFKEVSVSGTAVNTQGQYAQIIPSYWSEETKAYYNKLCTQTTTDFGFFTNSMVDESDGSYGTQDDRISEHYNRLSTALNYDYEIMPTYTHLRWYSQVNQFPLKMANTYAGGNGFNGKPVLQFTYQFTTTNNADLAGYTPMFDIMRGVYDAQFRELAADIKSYGKPILFRLNNEMNTDWTSYAGIVTLLDPDIFIITWQRMYDIFVEEGVNNCIWIFNPFDKTFPYSSWGEDVCFMPGAEYVQILGLTAYEDGNSGSMSSFKTLYSNLYEKNKSFYMNYPWVISEFACGAGGNHNGSSATTLGRYKSQQAAWITAMFTELNNDAAYCKNIKGAVWFSCNDYITINETEYIKNYFSLDSTLTSSLRAMKNGLATQ